MKESRHLKVITDNKPVQAKIVIGGVAPDVLEGLNRAYNTQLTEEEFQKGYHDWDFGSTFDCYNAGETEERPTLEGVIEVYSKHSPKKLYKKGSIEMAQFRRSNCNFDLFAYADFSCEKIKYKLLIRSDAKELAKTFMDENTRKDWFWDAK